MSEQTRAPEPPDGDERAILLGWLAFHRDALAAKCAGLDADALASRSADPSALSLLGLVRHLVEIERVYGVWGVGPKEPLRWVWGEYTEGGPEWDFDAEPGMLAGSLAAWEREKAATDERIRSRDTLDELGGNGYSVRWNLHKLVGEYARHNGHADLLRERIDGETGE
jgi:Protein of unknown function (DUF664)